VAADPEVLFSLVRAGFGQRRKMLRRALAGIVTLEQFERAGIASDARAESLGVEAWGALARVVGEDRAR
jgi:16S rRNA (adenine1518-N6/adenine1519-N6)-dimethyltransferase